MITKVVSCLVVDFPFFPPNEEPYCTRKSLRPALKESHDRAQLRAHEDAQTPTAWPRPRHSVWKLARKRENASAMLKSARLSRAFPTTSSSRTFSHLRVYPIQ